MSFRGAARRPYLEYDFQGDGLFRIGSNETVRSPEFPEEREEGRKARPVTPPIDRTLEKNRYEGGAFTLHDKSQIFSFMKKGRFVAELANLRSVLRTATMRK